MKLTDIIVTATNSIAPVILTILLGYILMQKGFLNKEFVKVGNKMVFKLCLPVMLFVNVYNIESFASIQWDIVLYCVVAVVVIFLNGAVNGSYYKDHTKYEQKYEGLVFTDREITWKLEPVVDFLVENGYNRGYAHFWNGNIITELSDGAIRFVNVHVDNLANISFNPWLCLKTNRTLEGTKDFLLLEAGQRASFESKNDLSRVRLVYQDENYVIYAIQK